VRVWRECPQEEAGQAVLTIRVPAPGSYILWLRGRGQGDVQCTASESSVTGPIRSEHWSWTRVPQPLKLAEGTQSLVLRSRDDGLCLDMLLLTGDARTGRSVWTTATRCRRR